MKYAFVVDTPYQLLSAISLCSDSEIQGEANQKDLFIDTKRSSNADMFEYAQKVLEFKIFDNVYLISSLTSTTKNKRIKNIIEWIFPGLSLVIGSGNKINFRKLKYDIVCVSGPFMLQRNIILKYPSAEVFFFEDGIGSYNERIGVDLLNKTGECAQRLFKRGPKYIFPSRMYLFCPDFYRGEYTRVLRKLDFPYERLDTLKKIYSVNNENSYTNKKVIFLSQPDFSSQKYRDIDDDLINVINETCRDNMIIRPHPAEDKSKFAGLDIDHYCEQWELMCSDQITERHVLIGKYSTAQFIPCLIYGKEPYIIFTYKIYGIESSGIEDSIERLKNMYKKRDRIICVNTVNELQDVVLTLKEVEDLSNGNGVEQR